MDLGALVGSLELEDSQFAQALSGAMAKLGDFASSGAKLAGVAGAGIALALGASVVQNLSVDAANDKLAAELGLTEAESKRVGESAGRLYADAYGESLEQVNDAVAAVMTSIDGMSTASSAELEGVTAKALDFASAFGVDVARSVQVVGQMMRTGLAADADEAYDLLVAGSQRVPVALREDLLDAVDEYGQFFSTLGYTGEEAFAVLVDGAQKGTYGIDKAGDAIKEFTIRATDMSTASVAAYDAIGLNAEDMSNKILAGGDSAADATQQIIGGLLGIEDPAARANAAIALFGTPIEDLNTTEIPAFLKSLQEGSGSMDGFAGAADRMGATLNDNAKTSLTSWKRQAQLAFLGLGNWAIPAVDQLAKSAADSLGPALSLAGDGFTILLASAAAAIGFIQAHPTVFTVIATIITTLLVPALLVLSARFAVTVAQMVLGWITTSASAVMSAALQVASLTLIGVQWAAAAARATAAALRMAAAWLISIGPIALVIAAVVGLVVLIVKNWDTIKAKTAAAWNAVVGFIKAFPGKAGAALASLGGVIWGVISGAWNRARTGTVNGVNNVVAFVRGLPGKIKSALGNLGSLLLGVGEDIMNGLVNGIERGFAWVRSKLSGVGGLIPGWLKKVLGISSPSKVMADEVGQWIPAGVAEGIDAGAARFLNPALDRMAAGVVVPITAAASYQASVDGLTAATNRGLAATGTDGHGGGPAVVQHVHPSPGMDEYQIGEAAAGRLMFGMNR